MTYAWHISVSSARTSLTRVYTEVYISQSLILLGLYRFVFDWWKRIRSKCHVTTLAMRPFVTLSLQGIIQFHSERGDIDVIRCLRGHRPPASCLRISQCLCDVHSLRRDRRRSNDNCQSRAVFDRSRSRSYACITARISNGYSKNFPIGNCLFIILLLTAHRRHS